MPGQSVRDMLMQMTASPSLLVLAVLIVMLAASCAVYWLLVQRLTSRRQWVAMQEWARGRDFAFSRDQDGPPPAPLDALPNAPRVELLLQRGGTSLLQLHTGPQPVERTPKGEGRWHLLVQDIAGDWPVTALRPSAHPSSLIDLFPLSSYPSLSPPERFVVFGVDPHAARALAESSLRALLPADVGLLLHGQRMVLDFSTRPFDPIELGRMVTLAEQLAHHVGMVRHVAGRS
jgi:hypothetical protein